MFKIINKQKVSNDDFRPVGEGSYTAADYIFLIPPSEKSGPSML